jgi:formamidopyrimidine-DNA glycosylase
MPELPDISAYRRALELRIVGEPLEAIRIASPFVLRSVDVPPRDAEGRTVRAVSRIGKRIAIELDGGVFAVVHLMIAGRLHWKPRGEKLSGRQRLAAFDFPSGTLVLTEAGTRKRASLHFVRSRAALSGFDRGGLEVLSADPEEFRSALLRENHTLKRALTDPRLFSGIGNAYSDEILHRARLSPMKWTSRLAEDEIARLRGAAVSVLEEWTNRLVGEAQERFPERVTAFREGMAVHGRFGEPCPECGAPVQRIVYAGNEANYCPVCQTGGRLLADRALSRLLHDDWPKTLEELEERGRRLGAASDSSAGDRARP